jgi:hypothetical protein
MTSISIRPRGRRQLVVAGDVDRNLHISTAPLWVLITSALPLPLALHSSPGHKALVPTTYCSGESGSAELILPQDSTPCLTSHVWCTPGLDLAPSIYYRFPPPSSLPPSLPPSLNLLGSSLLCIEVSESAEAQKRPCEDAVDPHLRYEPTLVGVTVSVSAAAALATCVCFLTFLVEMLPTVLDDKRWEEPLDAHTWV